MPGTLLVGPSDAEAPSYPRGTRGFGPMPDFKLPFQSIVIASSDDEYVTLERAREFATNWGSELVEVGNAAISIRLPTSATGPLVTHICKNSSNRSMLIQQKKIGSKGMFFVEQDGNILAKMTYTMPSENKMIIEHTEVSDELSGKNVGYQLVKTAVDYARKQNLKIVPLCPFARSIFDKKEELRDVLA